MEAVSEAKAALPENEKVIKLSEVQPLKLFREPSLFLTHGGQAIRVLMRAVVTYVLISFLGVLLFTIMYGCVGAIENPLFESCKVYWAFGTRSECIPTWMAFFETVFRDCIGVVMLGKIVTGMMLPNNPIEFSNFFIVNNDGQIVLRYWIMLPVGVVLHKARLRVLLIEDEEMTRGDGALRPKKRGDQVTQDFWGIRGVRTLELSEKLSKSILRELKNPETKYKMRFNISGSLVEGREYFSEKVYTIADMLRADDYLKTLKKEYPEHLDRREDMPDKMYMNFNMAYRMSGEDVKIYYRPTRYVRSKKQKEKKEERRKIDGFLEIATGEEWNKWMLENRQGRINKAINQLILFEYDKDRPIRAWLKKKFRQDGETEVQADGKQVHE